MKTQFTRNRMSYLSNYRQNALMQLIAASAIGFILAYALYVIFLVLAPDQKIWVNGVQEGVTFHNTISPYIALQPFSGFLHKPWTLLTYPWAHSNFWHLLTNMLWLYCFGSVIQSLIGFKEIIPLYIISSLFAGSLFLIVNAFWPGMGGSMFILGALPGIMGFAFASITLAPRFRFYLGDRLSIPLWAVLAIFVVINLMSFSYTNISSLIVCTGAAFAGFCYIKLLRGGYKPGAFIYGVGNSIQSVFTPQQHPNGKIKGHRRKEALDLAKINEEHNLEESIDLLLDKINQKGYDSLTKEEKETLMNASRQR